MISVPCRPLDFKVIRKFRIAWSFVFLLCLSVWLTHRFEHFIDSAHADHVVTCVVCSVSQLPVPESGNVFAVFLSVFYYLYFETLFRGMDFSSRKLFHNICAERAPPVS